MSFQLRENVRVSIPAEVVGIEIEALKAKFGGMVLPGQVVDAARSIRHPLHPHFEWDDTEAAKRHREDQARQLIRCYYVVPDDTPDPRPTIANVVIRDPDRGKGYVSTSAAMANPDWKAQVFQDVIRQLRGIEARLQNLKAAGGAVAHIAAAIESLEAKAKPPEKPKPKGGKNLKKQPKTLVNA